MPMRGAKQHTDRLKRLSGPAATARLNRTLFVCGDLVRTTAQQKITNGATSGKRHVPSRPGEPPNQDTGVLANNIETTNPAQLVVEVSSNAPYAAALEFGTSRMGERPYMRPSRDETKLEIVRLMQQAVSSVVKGSRRG